ncbi:hypothetical protein BC831DRAFT_448668 [Entophlyctis helioformis]|nr:hypothetical protein BC831DRAFT_448668 [Entophlyctis helioformis]
MRCCWPKTPAVRPRLPSLPCLPCLPCTARRLATAAAGSLSLPSKAAATTTRLAQTLRSGPAALAGPVAASGSRSSSGLAAAFDGSRRPAPVSAASRTPFVRFDPANPHTGLFGYHGLDQPSGFIDAARAGIEQAQHLVDLVCAAESDAEVRKTVKRLDTLSDMLCCVVDTAELIRNVHPNRAFVEAANHAHAALNSYLNHLNTHQGLYNALRRVLDTPTIASDLSEEERRVAHLLIVDFEKSGIHMPEATRRRFVELNDHILELGQEFVMNAAPAQETVTFDDAHQSLLGVPSQVIDAVCRASSRTRRSASTAAASSSSSSSVWAGARAVVPTSSDIASTVLRMARSDETRKRMFTAMNSASPHQLAVLHDMLEKRAELAALLGKKSYGHMYLVDKMAETPENVWSFLDSLAQANRPLADAEIARIAAIKRVHTGRDEPVRAWDRYYYTPFLTSHPVDVKSPGPADPLHMARAVPTGSENLAEYFTVGATFQGLSDVFKALYGITLEPGDVLPGEIWHDDIRKLHVVHETEGRLGTIYCDLFQRESGSGGGRKYENAAHFTVRCSRRLDDDHVDEGSVPPGLGVMGNPQNEKRLADGRVYQMPIVVLVMNFARPLQGRPGCLNLQEVDTLFHEMGHAMHSMLARTDFQHIAGTRVAMDFVEVPSILMEYFARSPEVLSTFGRHYKTGEPVPIELLRSRRSSLSTMESYETQQQLQMALLDQLYHSPLAMASLSSSSSAAPFDTTAILQQLQDRVNPIGHTAGTHWQVQFSHLFSYGASYYSYFWSRRWASRVHRKLFAGRPMHAWREGGEEVRQQVLRWGGGRDPWKGLEHIGIVKDGERDGKASGELADLAQE